MGFLIYDQPPPEETPEAPQARGGRFLIYDQDPTIGATPPAAAPAFDDMPAVDQGANPPAPSPAPYDDMPALPASDQGAGTRTKSPGLLDRFRALTTGTNEGLAYLAGLPVETVKNAVNLGIAGVGTVATALDRPDLAPAVIERLPGDIQSMTEHFTNSGFTTDNPNPEDLSSRILHGAGMGIGSSVIPGGGAGRAATQVAKIVAQPGVAKTVGSGAAAGTGATVAHEIAPDSTVAPLIGALVPAGVSQTAQATVRGAARGGEAGRQAMETEIRTFEDAGTTPSLGQATKRRLFRGAESGLASTPGGAGVMTSRAEQQATDVGTRVKREIEKLTPEPAKDVSGRVIKGGITGPDGWREQFRATSRQLYNDVDQHLPPTLRVTPQATTTKLDELTSTIQGAEKTSGGLINPKVAQIREDLTADLAANNGVLPYQALKELRTKVGKMMETSEILTDVPKTEIKELYGALTQDMRAAATQSGPKALEAFERANKYTADGHTLMEDYLQGIASKVDVEDIHKATMSGKNEGPSTLRAVKQSLKPDEFQVVAATELNRLGRATNRNQNEPGDIFSTETFLTNWNNLNPKARQELLSGYEGAGQIEHSLTAVAKMADNVRQGSKVWANPPGTAGAFSAKVGAGGLALTTMTGQFKYAGWILTAMAGANVTARTLTNPAVVKWVAAATKMPPSALPAHLTRLAAIAEREQDPETKAETEQLLQAAQQQLDSEKQGPPEQN